MTSSESARVLWLATSAWSWAQVGAHLVTSVVLFVPVVLLQVYVSMWASVLAVVYSPVMMAVILVGAHAVHDGKAERDSVGWILVRALTMTWPLVKGIVRSVSPEWPLLDLVPPIVLLEGANIEDAARQSREIMRRNQYLFRAILGAVVVIFVVSFGAVCVPLFVFLRPIAKFLREQPDWVVLVFALGLFETMLFVSVYPAVQMYAAFYLYVRDQQREQERQLGQQDLPKEDPTELTIV